VNTILPDELPGGESPPPSGERIANPLRILSLSCVYPNPGDPALGLFVCARLQRMAKLAQLKVIAPIARFDYAKFGKTRPEIPLRTWNRGVEVLHPAWIYPPGGYALNASLLYLRLLPLVRRIEREFRFQMIDAHFAFPDGIAACALAGSLDVPFTVTLRGNETMHARYALRRWLMGWALRKAAKVIVLSRKLEEFAVSLGVERQRIKIIPNGVDSEIFRPLDRAQTRDQYGLSQGGAKMILCAGTLIERKGHHRVVRAVAALRKAGMDVRLLIAGGTGREGRYEDEIRKEIAAADLQTQVLLLGEVAPQELARLMSAADVFCLASSREGWPNVIHEALACGTPVVATDVGAVPDLLPSADYGFVVPVGGDDALTEALHLALTKDWDRARISAWAHSRSWERVASDVISEFNDVVQTAQKAHGAPAN
jgi:teichuronic acid biosynthesis glycosyltransferase TuaC